MPRASKQRRMAWSAMGGGRREAGWASRGRHGRGRRGRGLGWAVGHWHACNAFACHTPVSRAVSPHRLRLPQRAGEAGHQPQRRRLRGGADRPVVPGVRRGGAAQPLLGPRPSALSLIPGIALNSSPRFIENPIQKNDAGRVLKRQRRTLDKQNRAEYAAADAADTQRDERQQCAPAP